MSKKLNTLFALAAMIGGGGPPRNAEGHLVIYECECGQCFDGFECKHCGKIYDPPLAKKVDLDDYFGEPTP